VGLLQPMPYDVIRDFAPIAMLSSEAFMVAVHPSIPAKTVKELIALAKSKPGQLNYASGTTGGPPHLGAELLKSMAGINLVRVAYKGTAPAVTGVLTGETEVTVADLALLLPHVKTGRLRGLAVTSAAPSALAPGMPTVAASGVPGFELIGGSGIWAPAKTPTAIINRLNQEIVRLLSTNETRDRFLSTQIEVVGSTPEQFANRIKTDIAKWTKVISEAGIKAN
jgi:tripartite-type tricarboxylate transporter receptor subunit TctC